MNRMQSAILPSAVLVSLISAILAISLPSAPPPGLPDAESKALPVSVQENDPIVESCQVSSAFPAAILRWCQAIYRHAKDNQLEPDLVAALMLQESGGDPEAYSSNGAVGLLQVMPRDGLAAEFMCANGPCFASRPSIDELKDPEYNLAYGTRMLATLVESTGSLRDALLHYGPIEVGYAYADTVIQIWEKYR